MNPNQAEINRRIKECQETQNPSLDLSEMDIEDSSHIADIANCQHITTLNLWNNKISDISFLQNLTNLTTLNFCFNNISDISFLQKLTNLTILHLSFNNIFDISSLQNLNNLTTLDLWSNKISDISFLQNLINLTTLDLSSNEISDYSFLQNLTNLTTLGLSSNAISDINFLQNLENLTTLHLSYNNISNINFLQNLKNLTTLHLSSNNIFNINFLQNLTNLTTLSISNNYNISNINFLQNLTNLTTLDLRSNKISDISFLQNLINLTTLDLSSNKISDYNFLQNLKNLTTLNLSYNEISDYSFLQNLTNLTTLDLSSNEISDISFLQNLKNLTTLNLRSNNISDINFLQNLKNLITLNLRSNNISDISFLQNLKNLTTLNLSNNNISKLPRWVLKRKFTLSYGEYERENKMNLYGNPFIAPPIETIKQGTQAITDWFEANKVKLNEIKVILIGDPKAGKTSLLKRLKDNYFDEYEPQTDGINITTLEFGENEQFAQQTKLNNITAYFWDFGGQEIMNATHQFFLTKRAVYILLLDARKDDDITTQIRKWVSKIQASAGEASIIIVGNKIDVNAGFGFKNEYELQQEFPQIKHYIPLSCKTKENIDKLKEALEKEIPKAELFHTKIDERWFDIKNQLQAETKAGHFLNESRFNEISTIHGLTDPAQRQNAIHFLHDLGIVLHFKQINLAEYYVLDPYWITYGVYQIITSTYAAQCKGIVPMDRLEFIINKEEEKAQAHQFNDFKRISYSTNERRFLVDILHYFKLCFFTPNKSHFILPDLLETKEPSEQTNPIRQTTDKIIFSYHYTYLPKTVLPYFMVEMHPYLSQKWRTGCIIVFENCKALISVYGNQLSITVTNGHKQKRELLSIIRYKIEKVIHAALNLQPKRMIPLPNVTDAKGKVIFVSYDILLKMEKRGHQYYDIYEPIERTFEISKLLEGITSDLSRLTNKIDLILHNQYKADKKLDTIQGNLAYIKEALGDKFDALEKAIQTLNTQQRELILKEVLNYITTAFTIFEGIMNEELEDLYTKFNESDNVDVQLKLGVPLIPLLGIHLEAKFDVKKWAKAMYEKYGLDIFKLIGHL